MSEFYCPECGYPLNGYESSCPECGCVLEWTQPLSEETSSVPLPPPPQLQPDKTYYLLEHIDLAQYIYECAVIGWQACKKFFAFTGRASRREFWSFYFLYIMIANCTCGLGFLIFLLPFIGVSIRRMHDINRCGWWCICPIISFFFCIKKSDIGVNYYGPEEPAKDLLL